MDIVATSAASAGGMGSAAAMAILIAVRLLFYGVFAALAVLGICALA